MKEIKKIRISKLKFDDDINQLVPEMTEKEFEDLVANIEMQGQHTPIHINRDNTVLDGRHRIKALKMLEIKDVTAIRENLKKNEALKFVRDTAVERRNLTANQKLNIVLNAKDLIDDIQERAKKRQQKSIEVADEKNSKKNKGFSSAELNPKNINQHGTPVHENKEIAELAGVSKSTVMRAKKVKNENPKAYEEVIKNNGGWDKAYRELESVKNRKASKEKEVADVNTPERSVESPKKETETPKPKQRDRREEINARADALTDEEKNLMEAEGNAVSIISLSDNLLHLLEGITDLELTMNFLNSQNTEDLAKIVKLSKGLNKIIEKGDFKNV